MALIAESFEPLVAPKRLTVLGSTGSVGCSTLDLIGRDLDRYEVDALVGNSNVLRLAEQARAVNARCAVTADAKAYTALKAALSGTGIEVAAGPDAVIEAAQRPVDIVMASIVGAAGLAPTIAAARNGTTIGLANKECLVSGGTFFTSTAARAGAKILPVDSEHSAVFQVLNPDHRDQISRIILTASGGPFRTFSQAQLDAAGPEQALKHPNWSMGQKITIDSASLMNKGLELIEAFHLFDVDIDQLDVLVHPQSIIHSLVEYRDGSTLAQLGMPDMRTPIAYALAWPGRIEAPVAQLRLEQIGQLTFEALDEKRFPAVALCLAALARGGSATTVLNAANEIAVAEFLSKRIPFPGITALVSGVLDRAEGDDMLCPLTALDDVFAADAYGRRIAAELVASGFCSR
ncbi:1-deoxy-D-xylulose-5-phosphate reductoisomerase [Rhodoligotrophos appendicifer]|nr:1-deoxy-D-xylulose-5-phosphate reductoisomerase [Rhodoligotrophos appendicifer]